MPTQDELKLAIEQEKKNFFLQHPNMKIDKKMSEKLSKKKACTEKTESSRMQVR